MAYDRLVRIIRSGRFPKGSKLPTVITMARLLRVSKPVILHAIKELEKQGQVVRKPRSGIFVKGCPPDSTADVALPMVPRRSKAEWIAAGIQRDILEGNLRIGERLAPPKVLQHRYPASGPTIRAAIRILQQKGLVHRVGWTVVVGPYRRLGVGTNRKYLVITEWPMVRIGPKTNFANTVLHSFADAIQFQGFQIQMKGIGELSSKEILPSRDDLNRARGVFLACGPHVLRYLQQYELAAFKQTLRQAKEASVPVAAFQLIPFSKETLRLAKEFPRLYLLSQTGLSTEILARYLASLGHRRFSFFALAPDGWNGQLLDSLAKQLDRILGNRAHLQPFLIHFDAAPLRSAVTAKGRAEAFKCYLAEAFHSYRFQGLNPANHIFGEVFDFVCQDRIYVEMSPLFAKALKEKSGPVWVCAEPQVAAAARHFLWHEKIRVPQDINVVSMSDSHELLIHSITGYNHQPERIGYMAAHCLLGDIPIKRNRQHFVGCPGRIIDRGSVMQAQR